MIKKHLIKNEQEWLDLRANYINSTEMPALYGLEMASAPTAFELWHIKKGEIDNTIQPNNYMLWGKMLEPVIAELAALDRDWET